MISRKNKSTAYQIGYGHTQFRKGQTCSGSRIPCSAKGNSLFRTEQGILCNALMSLGEKGHPPSKTAAKRQKTCQIPC
jgi:hypothetical protein